MATCFREKGWKLIAFQFILLANFTDCANLNKWNLNEVIMTKNTRIPDAYGGNNHII